LCIKIVTRSAGKYPLERPRKTWNDAVKADVWEMEYELESGWK
jgi:hypothetical protein